jgi:K+-sensing histidine kinase KdpD
MYTYSNRFHSANSQVLIAIEDNGSGIPDAIRDKIFQLFSPPNHHGRSNPVEVRLTLLPNP